MKATARILYDHYIYYREKNSGNGKRMHGFVKKHVDEDFTSARLLELYQQTNWNSFIKEDLEGHFDLYEKAEQQKILDLWVKAFGPMNGTPSKRETPSEEKPKPKPKPKPSEEAKPQTTTPEPTPAAATPDGVGVAGMMQMSMGQMLQAMALEEMPKVKQAIEGRLEKMIQDEADKRVPTQVLLNEIVKGTVTGKQHKKFEKLLRKLNRHRKAFLAGPTGSGKTYLAEQVSKAMGLPFASLSMSAGMSEGHLTGRTTINGDYISTKFVDFYENGGVFLIDEVDAGDANTLLVLNKALSNAVGGTIGIPYRESNPEAVMHKDFLLVCAGNTWGDGDDGDYTGREILDRAFMNRFSTSKIEVDYDEELEEELMKDCPEVFRRFREIRRNVVKNNINQVVATRTMVDARMDYLDGDDIDTIIEDYMSGWSKEEKAKAIA